MKVIFSDGKVYEGDNAVDIVNKLRLDMWDPPKDSAEYMEGVAGRAKVFYGGDMTYLNEDEFLNELLRLGDVVKIEK